MKQLSVGLLLLFAALPARAALVQTNSCSGAPATNPTGTITCAFTSNNASGNAIVVVASYKTGFSATLAATDSRNSYTTVDSIFGNYSGFGPSSGVYFFLATNIGAGANTITITYTAVYGVPNVEILIAEYSQVPTSSAVDAHNTYSDTSVSVTTANGNDLLIAYGTVSNWIYGVFSISPSTGWTKELDNQTNQDTVLYDEFAVGPASYTETITQSGAFSTNSIGGLVALKYTGSRSASKEYIRIGGRILAVEVLGTQATILATAGTPQSATVSTAFATALQATVKDANNNPVGGVTVTFTAPSSGATGTFSGSATAMAVTNASGLATAPTFTANATAGSYTVTASAPGVSFPASFSLTNTQ